MPVLPEWFHFKGSIVRILTMLKTGLFLGMTAIGLFALHHLALWMERRGWIFYKHTQATSGAASAALGNAMQELNAFAEPQARHAIEERQSQHKQQDHFDGLPKIDSDDAPYSGSE